MTKESKFANNISNNHRHGHLRILLNIKGLIKADNAQSSVRPNL